MGDDAARCERTVFLRRVPKRLSTGGKKTSAADVVAWIERQLGTADPVEDCFLLHSRSTAQVQLRRREDAALLVSKGRERWDCERDKVVEMCAAKSAIVRDPQMGRPEEYIREEVKRSLNEVIRGALTNLGRYNFKRKRDENHLLNKRLKMLRAGDVDRTFCWDFARSGGRFCPRGSACVFDHVTLPPERLLSSLPPSMRDLRAIDAFPKSRQHDPTKLEVNETLARLAASDAHGVRNPRALCLDGPELASTQAFRRCAKHRRAAEHVVVPNSTLATFREMEAKGLAAAHFGTLRSYLEESLRDRAAAGDAFGLLYLDYCCRLRAGAHSVAKSPVEDLKLLLSSRCGGRPFFVDAAGCILAVCLRKEAPRASPGGAAPLADASAAAAAAGVAIDAPAALRDLVRTLCAANGVSCESCEPRFSYGGEDGNFVEIFALRAAAP